MTGEEVSSDSGDHRCSNGLLTPATAYMRKTNGQTQGVADCGREKRKNARDIRMSRAPGVREAR